jgi:hypothetical protein
LFKHRCLWVLPAVVFLLHCSRPPQLETEISSLGTQSAIRQRIAANFSALQSLKGQATLTVETPELSYTAGARIWFHRPDSLFIKVEVAFGIDVGWLYSAGNRFVLYLPRQNICYTGSTSALPLEEFISFNMSYSELLRLLFGEESPEGVEKFRSTIDGKEWLLTGTKDSLAFRYRYDSSRGVVTEVEVRDQIGMPLRLKTFSRFTKKNKVMAPQSIRLQQPGENRAIGLFYHSLSINENVILKNLKMRIPQNAQRIELED